MSRFGKETLWLPAARGNVRVHRRTTATIVGGGIAGVAAATILAERGVEVTILEALPYLGGRVSGWTSRFPSGQSYEMERGFHAFFRQYYNLRALLKRVDPSLSLLRPVPDYPIIGPSGLVQSFVDLPKRAPLQILALLRQTPFVNRSDLWGVDMRQALAMLTFDLNGTYGKFDGQTAKEYLDGLHFPARARQMLFDVFARSFFNPEDEMSAAELLMMFHFYFIANPEGLLFDVVAGPFSTTLWAPFAKWLADNGVSIRTGTRVERIEKCPVGWRIRHADGHTESDLLVLALDVTGLQRLCLASPDLALGMAIDRLSVTRPFAVLRLWMVPGLRPDRAPFVGTTGVGVLDNISIFEKLEHESAAWASAHQGSVVELHAYAVPVTLASEPQKIREALLAGLRELYPEASACEIVHEHLLVAHDCPAFPPRSYKQRPGVKTPFPNLALAGDFVKMPLPCALMERAAAAGILAANTLLAPLGVKSEPLYSVPRTGLFASPFRSSERTKAEAAIDV